MRRKMLTLLGLVSEPPGLVWAGGAGAPVHLGQLAVLPAPASQST